ncbi:hypothetical protein [Synechococcus sp. PCC 6312]|uniref:hypothetical protein n=1 Tax=Synechococcus sp. (strain ATCC 27167 / PCC 6312) TaxID=195253 RepID=UPI00029F4BE8|nr:hypothetical protein [Synechococcus sp. PCC 6312]AFY59495.1 hypothetical protein Syn6312_0254 [Synechococcus sp. PCC 6312]
MITLLSLFSGSLGLSLIVTSQWWFWLGDQALVQQEEEEDLTQYQTQPNPQATAPKGSSVGWEFKIVRAQRSLFHQPETLKKVCQEEAQGGWTLLEKLDDRRLRFKRPTTYRNKPNPSSNYDPYRSFYGSRWSLTPILSGIIAVTMTALPAYLAYRLVSLQLSHSPSLTPEPASQFPRPSIPPNSSPLTPPLPPLLPSPSP